MCRIPFILRLLGLLLLVVSAGAQDTLHIRAAIFTQTVPLSYVDDLQPVSNSSEETNYQGYLPDLLKLLQEIALDRDNVTLTFEFEQAQPFEYTRMINLVEEDCNTTSNENLLEDCNKYDLVVGDFYAFPERSLQTQLTPPFLSTAAATIKYIKQKKRSIETLAEAEALQVPVCLLDESYYDTLTLRRYPDLVNVSRCKDHAECFKLLKEETCSLFVEDELQLRYYAKRDPELELTREKFAEQFVVMPMNKRTLPITDRDLVNAWIIRAKNQGWLDELEDEYFNINFCPLGKAGPDCLQNCSASNGVSDRYGVCVCDSIRWTGDDCSISAEVNYNWLPNSLVWISYGMVALNLLLCLIFGTWLFVHRKRAQVSIAQPYSLALILLGCVISTSTILAMAQQDNGSGSEPTDSNLDSCMVIPWLYSLGFSITFGTLFAKIRRIYVILQSAVEMRRVAVTFQETLKIVGLVLLLDVTILIVWTVIDPLQWERTTIQTDQYDYVLESEGNCESEHWMIWTSIIGSFHILLVAVACFMCYLARHMPEEISNGKHVALAVASNMQIYIVAVPVVLILGSGAQSKFFVQSAVIWINDFVVLTVIFVDLIRKVHKRKRRGSSMQRQSSEQTIQLAIQKYAQEASNRESDQVNPGDNRFLEYMSSVIQSISNGPDDRSNEPPSFQGGDSSELTNSVTKVPGDPSTEGDDEEVTGEDTETPPASIGHTDFNESDGAVTSGLSQEFAR